MYAQSCSKDHNSEQIRKRQESTALSQRARLSGQSWAGFQPCACVYVCVCVCGVSFLQWMHGIYNLALWPRALGQKCSECARAGVSRVKGCVSSLA